MILAARHFAFVAQFRVTTHHLGNANINNSDSE